MSILFKSRPKDAMAEIIQNISFESSEYLSGEEILDLLKLEYPEIIEAELTRKILSVMDDAVFLKFPESEETSANNRITFEN